MTTKSAAEDQSPVPEKPAGKKPLSARQGIKNDLDTFILSARAWRQMMFWISMLVILIVFVYVFRSILLPYFAGMALAYLLDPVADWLESKGANRLLATSLILLVFLLLFTYIAMRILPVLATQLVAFLEDLPGYVTQLQDLIINSDNDWVKKVVGDSTDKIRENFDGFLQQGIGWLSTLLNSLWSSGKAIVDMMSLLVITPIVAFYLLLDWDRMTEKVAAWIPRDHKSEIHEIAGDINDAIAGFVRGQGMVCVLLGAFYGVSLSMAGLNFGLLIGIVSGLISFIPFVGSLIGFLLSVGVAVVQFWPDYVHILIICGIFAAGQFIEGNILQPKLVGGSVGLHPVWLMFALSAFGVLMGFTGLLIAVPVAAAIGVLVRFALKKYLVSDYYLGAGVKPGAAPEIPDEKEM